VTVESVICAVCGQQVALDEDHRVVTDEAKRMRDRDKQEDYVLHLRCADAVFEGWCSP